jgi:DNA-binding GntR family transcriptional regulator
VVRLETLTADLGRLETDTGLRGVTTAQALDLRFHRTYEEAVASPQLAAELASLHARRERYVRVYTEAMMQAHHLRESIAEHEAIIEAVRAGDPDRAEASAEANFRNALVRFHRLVAVLGERGSWY